MDFLPAPLSMIPPAVRDELRQVFDDLDAECCGLLTPAQVTGGLELNGVSLSHAEIAALIRAMDPTGSGWISFEPFLCCIYALSLTQREVCTSRVYAVFPDSDFPARGSTGLLRLRRAVWLALEDPQSSKPAFWTAVAIVVVIVASTLGIIVETFPDVRASNPAAFDGLEVVCAAFFSVELVLRAACTPYLATFLFQARTAVDILAVAPFYVTLIAAAPGSGGGAAGAALRVVRVLRVVRLFKLGRYVTWMRIFTRTFLDALPALGSEWRGYIRSRTRCQRWDSEASARGGRQCVYPSCGNAQGRDSCWSSEGCIDATGGCPPPPAVLLFMATLAAVVFASLGYYAERGEWSAARGEWVRPDDSRSPFQVRAGAPPHGSGARQLAETPSLPALPQSIPETLWFTVVTMTTVGYGEVAPITAQGRAVTVAAMFVGILLLAIPISVISNTFHAEYARVESMRRLRRDHEAQVRPRGAGEATRRR